MQRAALPPERASPLRADDRITLVAAVVLVAVTGVTAIATFSVLQRRLQDIVQEDLLSSMARRADVFQDMIELREESARIAATRPAAARNIKTIRAGKDDGSNLANIRAVVDSFVKQGFSAIAYRDLDRKVVAAGGSFVAAPELKVSLRTPGRAELLWRDGYVLGHRLPVYDNGELVGDVVTEQPLPVLTRLTRTPAGRGETWDMGVCVKDGDNLACFPQLLMSRVFSTPLLNVAGEQLPMTRALSGETGAVVARDYRERYVLAAYGPVGTLGLGMVVKVDTAEIFGPIREQLGVALGLLLVLAAAGTAVLRRQVKPLAARLLESERKLTGLNAELDRRIVELQAANQELEAFSYSVSHDLRAPLRHISGYAEMLWEEAAQKLDDSARRHLDVIRDSVSRMGKLIDSLLAFSRMSRIELAFEDVDMQALARQALEEAERLPGHPPIEWIVAPLPAAKGDAATLRQVWLNLLSNAVKYSAKRAAPRIEIGCERLGDALCYSVRDNGAGFDMRYAHKLFGVFQRLHQQDEFEGTGIGLASVRRILSRHGGRIWAEGKPGEGAAFFFTLPAGTINGDTIRGDKARP
jgi:signal transduction histidine kinase